MWFLAALAGLGMFFQIEAQPHRTDAEQEQVEHVPQLTRAPELKTFVDAEYPEGAAAEEIEGEVVLLLTLDETGKVSDVTLTQGLDPRFDEAAIAAARQLEFTPAEVDGAPAPIQLEFRYVFELQAPPEPEPVAAPEPPVTFRGRVLVRGRRDPIPDVLVRSGEAAVTTDAEGRFELRLKPNETHFVEVIAPGFHVFETEEQIVEGEVTEVTYYLLRKSGDPYETVVRAPRPKKEVSQVVIEREEVAKVPGTFGDPLRVIENLPGMARAPYIGGQLLVRGASPSDSGVYFDGVEIPLLYHFGGLTSVVNAEFLEEIDFQPGGFGARYGRATAGVVDVSSRRLTGELARGSAKVDLMDSSVFWRQPVTENLSFAVAGRRSYIDLFLPTVMDVTTGGLSGITLAPVYSDYQAKIDWDASPDHDLTLFVFGSSDTMSALVGGGLQQRDVSFDLRLAFHRIMLGHEWRLAPGLTLRSQPFAGATFEGAGGGESGGVSGQLDLDLYEAGLREDLTWKASEQLTVRGGLDVYAVQGQGRIEGPVPNDLIAFPSPMIDLPDSQLYEIESGGSAVALWTETTWEPLEGLRLTPGLRFELYTFPEQNYRPVLDPRLAARYALREGTTVKGAFGVYHRPPSIFQLNELVGDPELWPEAARHYVVGVEQVLTDYVDLDVQLFFNQRLDLVAGADAQELEGGELEGRRYLNTGDGRAYGAEVLLRHKLSERFFGWIAYTLMRSEDRSRPENDYLITEYDQTHILTLVGSYRVLPGLEIGARFRLVTGNPYTPVIDASHDLDNDGWRALRGDPRSARMPTFHQLDLRAEYTMVFNLYTLSFFLDLLNAYNQQNVEDFQYDYRYREQVPFAGLPLVPILGVRGQW